jgi:regulatory protein
VRITKIEIQKRTPGRVSIFADGEFLIGLSKETLLRAGLRVGDQISSRQIDELTVQETLLSAKNAALRLLAVRPRSEKELIDRLREKEFSEQDVAAVVGELRTAGLVNDAEFARAYIRNTLTLRPVGELQLRRRLLLLGVSKQVIDGAVASTLADVDMSDVARKAALAYRKRLQHSAKSEDPRKIRNKISAFLARRGYSWTTISTVLKTLDLPKGNESDDEQSGL